MSTTTAITNTTAWITDILDRDDAGLLSASPAARQRVTVQDCIARGAVRCLVFLSERHGWGAEDWPRVISAAFGPPAYHSISTAACAVAAAGGHLSMLKLLRERECAWDDETCTRAAARGRQEWSQLPLLYRCHF